MSEASLPWYVLTGGPCAGKTTLILEFEKRGHAVLPEAARMYIEGELAKGKTIPEMRANLLQFEKNILRYHVKLEMAAPQDKTLFLDRGIPDNVAYFRFTGLAVDDELQNAAKIFTYRKVFLLEMLDYANDGARFETAEEAQRIHAEIRRAYQELGYDVLEVPVMPVHERADFILKNL